MGGDPYAVSVQKSSNARDLTHSEGMGPRLRGDDTEYVVWTSPNLISSRFSLRVARMELLRNPGLSLRQGIPDHAVADA